MKFFLNLLGHLILALFAFLMLLVECDEQVRSNASGGVVLAFLIAMLVVPILIVFSTGAPAFPTLDRWLQNLWYRIKRRLFGTK